MANPAPGTLPHREQRLARAGHPGGIDDRCITVTVRLVFVALLGALIGYERERHDSAAGLGTHMLVALGSAMFVVVPARRPPCSQPPWCCSSLPRCCAWKGAGGVVAVAAATHEKV